MKAWFALLLALCLAACGGLEEATGIPDPFGTPQPFRGTGDQRLVAGVLGERPIYIGPIANLDEKADAALRAAISKEAEAFDVMASSTAMTFQALTLAGTAHGSSVAFTLFDGSRTLATFSATGDPASLAADAARQLAQAIGRLGDLPPTPTPENAPLIFVREVTGPSAAVTEPLKRAVHDKLAEMGARMAEGPAEGAYVVSGAITLADGGNGTTSIALVWRVLAPDGRDLGKADQANALPTDAVQKTWPEIATMAGRAAAGSVAQIIATDFNKPKS
ncbi:MAG: hypothetical protein IT548_18675 [Alphaproteobacteria bacterium]|nr:hypothetical protein [Alphaproteobacteria bacterium]